MKKRFLTILVILTLVLSSITSFASSSHEFKSWGEDIDEWGFLALYMAGEDISEYSLPIPSSKITTDYQAHAVYLAAKKEKNQAVINKIKNAQLENGKFADYTNSTGEELLNSHIWGIISLYVSGEDFDRDGALKWLKENQNDDGGFSVFTDDFRSSPDMTSMGIIAYHALGLSNNSKEVSSAIKFVEKSIEKHPSCETISYYIMAKKALKESVSKKYVDFLNSHKISEGKFFHTSKNKEENYMASWHGLMAASELKRNTSIYDELMLSNSSLNFSDISKSHPNYDAVLKLSKLNIVSGYSDNTFRGNNTVSRAEFSKMLCLAQNISSSNKNYFEDTKNHWSKKYVSALVEKNILRGNSSNKFNPDSQITGAEISAIMCRALNLESEANKLKGDNWYDGYVKVLKNKRFLNESFSPSKKMTRFECVSILNNII